MRKSLILQLFFLFSLSGAFAQSLDTLRYADYLQWLRLYHPVSQQASITLDMGEMEVRTARGGFDPLIYGNLDQKTFDSKNYYDNQEAGITIPTLGGVELNGNFEQNAGDFLNPESSVPSGGLISAGASVQLGRGLLLDERRAALQQAKLYQQSTEAEREAILNGLYVDGVQAYWNWSQSFANMQAFEEAVRLTKVRFEAVKQSFQQGDVAAIDTVEAYAQLLNREYRLQGLQNDFFVQTQLLSSYLWNEAQQPMFLQASIVPELLSAPDVLMIQPAILRENVPFHPELRLADFELASLEVDRRLKVQSILPVVKLKYNFLTEPVNGFEAAPFFENDYKFGISFYTPLFLRKARGAIGMARAKIDFKQNARDLKELQIRTKLEGQINSWLAINQQVNTLAENVANLERLLSAEIRKFEMGESSLFLVNAREVYVFDARIKLNELIAKRKIAHAKARYAAGLGFEF